MVRLWLSRERLPSSLEAFLGMLFTMMNNFLPIYNLSGFHGVAVTEGMLKNCVLAVQKNVGSCSDPMYEVLPDGVVSKARGALSRQLDLYHPLDSSLWIEIRSKSWIEILIAWRSLFGWFDPDEGYVEEWLSSPEIGYLQASGYGGR